MQPKEILTITYLYGVHCTAAKWFMQVQVGCLQPGPEGQPDLPSGPCVLLIPSTKPTGTQGMHSRPRPPPRLPPPAVVLEQPDRGEAHALAHLTSSCSVMGAGAAVVRAGHGMKGLCHL